VAHILSILQALDCDFYVFSGPQNVWAHRHRRLVRKKSCIRRFTTLPNRPEKWCVMFRTKRQSSVLPYRLEAGTPNNSKVLIGLRLRVDFLNISRRTCFIGRGNNHSRARLFSPTIGRRYLLFTSPEKKHHVSIIKWTQIHIFGFECVISDSQGIGVRAGSTVPIRFSNNNSALPVRCVHSVCYLACYQSGSTEPNRFCDVLLDAMIYLRWWVMNNFEQNTNR